MTRTGSPDQAALSLELDGDGVAWLVFDRPDRPVNLLTSNVLLGLDALLGEIESLAAAGRLKVLVVRSGKPDHFIAGADVDEIAALEDPAEITEKSATGQRIFRRLECLPVPTIAAIHGACLGGGTELALACTFRLASDAPVTRIGLPEVRLGLIPGFGGTVRLPRLVGLTAALDLIVTGKSISANRARRIGLVDEAVPAPIFMDRVRRFAWAQIDRAWKPESRRHSPLYARLLDDTAPGRSFVLSQARRRVLRETRGRYPAPLAAIDLIGRTIAAPLDEAFRQEAEVVGSLVAGPICKNLIHVFRLMESAKKPLVQAPAADVERVAVLGAGVMGGGIAQLLAYRGLRVQLKDIRAEALSEALRHARKLFDRAVERGRLQPREARQMMDRIAPTLDYRGIERADFVIEAVVERLDVKRQVLAEAAARAPAVSVFASNTSSLSIGGLQDGFSRPDAVCGMHFFNPVHRMPLVEIVRGPATSDETIATTFALARRLDKTPLVVRDGAGFLVNRLLAPYLNEAGWLLADGASIGEIDGALLEFGMPMGPLRLLDEIGWDVAGHVASVLYDAFGERMRPAPPLAALAASGRTGRKGGRGFYRYERGREEGEDESVYAELGVAAAVERPAVSAQEIQERAILSMVNEAARALEDGIVTGAGDVDLGMITGAGFPPFRGGLLRYADGLGLPFVLERLRDFESRFGPRFSPAPLIEARVNEARGFY